MSGQRKQSLSSLSIRIQKPAPFPAGLPTGLERLQTFCPKYDFFVFFHDGTILSGFEESISEKKSRITGTDDYLLTNKALKKVEDIIDPKIIQLFGDGGAPMQCKAMLTGQSSLRSSMRPWRIRYENWKDEKMICPATALLFCGM